MKMKFSNEQEFQKLLNSKSKTSIIKSHLHEGESLVAFEQVLNPYLLENGIVWQVAISQDTKEVFAALNKLVFYLVILAAFLIVIMIPMGLVFGGIIAKPIKELHAAAEEVMKGNWDYRIQVKSGDEIERFADCFRDLLSNLKEREKELIQVKQELKGLTKNLEEKVKERTRDLTDSQDASLNILEDLSQAKEELELQTWGLTKANEGIKTLYKELERADEQLKKLDQLKSDFISIVSHELRTPLSITKEGISLVLDRVAGEINEKQSTILATALMPHK